MSRIKHQKELLKPFPSSQSDKGFVVSFHGAQSLTHRFAALFSAQTFVEEVINERPVKWKSNTELRVGGLIIQAKNLEEIIEYKPTKPEREWELSKDQFKYAKLIRDGKGGDIPKETPIDVKSSADGTTIAELCKQLKLEPSVARARLRKHKIAKPYAWKNTAPIIKILKGE